MKIHKLLLISGLVLVTIILTFCEKKAVVLGPPEASFSVNPENGNTTTIFYFNTAETNIPGFENPELFFRWDWDGDGDWDTHFSKSKEYEYRFMSPGTYDAKMEVRNVNGLIDSLSTTIEVVRGNSAPIPVLKAVPDIGHIRTKFIFDASGSHDDEDSLNTLQFRWDWEGDGIFDTEFSNETVLEHVFAEPGFYRVVLEVMDPWGLSARTNKLIDISLNNPRLHTEFTWGPEGATTSDIITLDASACYDPDDPDNTFQYRWDLNNDTFYDTDWLDTPIFEHTFKEEGENSIKLQIRDQYGLTKSVTEEIVVLHSNQPPIATFEIGSIYGNLTTEFYFDAGGVRDDEDFYNVLEVRWDFESDGVFDTEFSMTKTARHFYGVAGDYNITMEVKDSGGLTDIITKEIHISSGTNETDLVIDEDNGVMYGAVKIGNQWWISENVKIPGGRSCYRNNPEYCDLFGGLYNWPTAMNNSTSQKAQGICPDGYHIPTVEEWEELFDYVGRDQSRTQLEVGGSTDFRMLYGGQQNPNGASEYGGTVVNFWTSSKLTGTNAWAFSLQDGKDQVWKITLGQSYKISVRCVKN